jgi:carboxymethylenebutenolidase
MSKTTTLRRTIGYSEIFDAAATWYGAIRSTDASAVDIPIVASYGAEDRGIPVDEIESFRSHLRVPSDIKIYPGAGHAFCDDTRPGSDAAACEDSWQRAIAFLKRHLE